MAVAVATEAAAAEEAATEATVAATEESAVAALGAEAAAGAARPAAMGAVALGPGAASRAWEALAASLAVGVAPPSATLRPPAQTSFASDPLAGVGWGGGQSPRPLVPPQLVTALLPSLLRIDKCQPQPCFSSSSWEKRLNFVLAPPSPRPLLG